MDIMTSAIIECHICPLLVSSALQWCVVPLMHSGVPGRFAGTARRVCEFFVCWIELESIRIYVRCLTVPSQPPPSDTPLLSMGIMDIMDIKRNIAQRFRWTGQASPIHPVRRPAIPAVSQPMGR